MVRTTLLRRLLLLLPAGILALAGAAAYVRLLNAFRHPEPIAEYALTRLLRRPVTLDRLDITRPGEILVRGLRVDGASTGGALLKVPEAVARYDWRSILSGDAAPLAAISTIDVRRPELVLERYRSNRLNLQDLFPPSRRPPADIGLRARINVSDGYLTYIDHAARVTPSPAVLKARLSATVDASRPPLVGVSVRGRGADARLASFSASGSVEPRNGALSLHITADSPRMGYWSEYFADIPGMKVNEGAGSATVDVWRTRKSEHVAMAVGLRVADANVSTPYVKQPVRDLTGRLNLTLGKPTGVFADLNGRAGSSLVAASGAIVPGDGPVRLAIRASASGLTPDAVGRLLGRQVSTGPAVLRDAARVEGFLYGTGKSITVAGEARTRAASLQGTELKNVHVAGVWRDGRLDVPLVQADASGRRVSAAGSVRPADGRMLFDADVSALPVSTVSSSLEGLGGILDGRVRLGGRFKDLVAEVGLSIENPRFGSMRGDALTASIRYQGRNVDVLSVEVAQGTGAAAASGRVSLDGPLNLRFAVAGLPLETLAAGYASDDVSGLVFGSGTLKGTRSAPVASVKARAFDVRVAGQRVDLVSGSASFHDSVFSLDPTLIASYPSQATLSGRVTLRPHGSPILDLAAKLDDGLLETLLADRGIRNNAVIGRVSGSAKIGGTLGVPDVRGAVRVVDATVSEVRVSEATAAFEWSGGALKASDIRAASGDAVLVAPTLSLSKSDIRGKFAVTGVRPTNFAQFGLPFVALDGVFTLSEGEVWGRPAAPVVKGFLASSGSAVAINGVVFDRLSVRGGWNGSRADISEAKLIGKHGATVQLTLGKLDPGRKTVAGNLFVDKLSAPVILDLLQGSPWVQGPGRERLQRILAETPRTELAGNLGANLTIAETFVRPSVTGTITLDGPDGVRYRNWRITRASVDGKVSHDEVGGSDKYDPVINIDPGNLVVEYKDAASNIDVAAFGRFIGKWNGDISDAGIDVYDVPLSVVTAMLPAREPNPMTGLIEIVTVTAEGKLQDPNIKASVKATIDGRGAFPKLAIDTGAITVGGGRAEANEAKLTAKDRQIIVSGSMPFRYPWLPEDRAGDKTSTDARRTDQTYSVKASLTEQSLDIVEFVAPPGPDSFVQMARGVLKGDLSIAGELRQPGERPAEPVDDRTEEGGPVAWLAELDRRVKNLKVDGNLKLTDGRFAFRPFVNAFKDANLALQFDGANLRVEECSVASTSGGTLAVSGGVSPSEKAAGLLASNLDLALDTTGFRLEETPGSFGFGERVRGTVDGRVRVTGDLGGPKIEGALTLSKVDVVPFGAAAAPRAGESTPLFKPDFNLAIIAGRDCWVRVSTLKVKMDDRQPEENRRVVLRGKFPDAFSATGKLTAREGSFTYPTARFVLTGADANINYHAVAARTANAAAPFDFRASAKSRLFATISGRRQPVTVYLTAQGPTRVINDEDSPYRVDMRSEPSISQNQLVALITRQDALVALTQGTSTAEEILLQETVNVLQASVLPAALSGFESSMSQALGLESLALEYMDQNRAVTVSVAKRLAPRLVVELSVPFGVSQTDFGSAWLGRLSYSLTPSLRLSLLGQRGPFLLGSVVPPSGSVTSTSATYLDTALMLEGTIGF